MLKLRVLVLPAILAASSGLSGCATSTGPATTTSLAPMAAAPALPETVEEVPSASPGSVEDGLRSLAHDVEMNAQAKPAAYATQQPASSVAAVEQLTGKTAIQTVSVPAGAGVQAAVEPAPAESGNSVVEAVVQAPVNVAKATAGAIGAAAQALPNPFGGDATDETGTPPSPPDGRLGPAGGVAARSPELDRLMKTYADYYGVPEELVRKVARRESTFNPSARNGRYLGLMQISHATARGMGYRGAPAGLLDAETNLKYAVRYLRGAYVVANGNHGVADRLYQSGYYYHAKRAGLLDETGVGRDRIRRRRL
ncbi:MAG: transglycosylase SLT domain-containing protein [Rhizobiaceae bacterium]